MKLSIEIPTGVGSQGNGHDQAAKGQPDFDPNATIEVLELVVPWSDRPKSGPGADGVTPCWGFSYWCKVLEILPADRKITVQQAMDLAEGFGDTYKSQGHLKWIYAWDHGRYIAIDGQRFAGSGTVVQV